VISAEFRGDIVVARMVLMEIKAVAILLPVHKSQRLT